MNQIAIILLVVLAVASAVPMGGYGGYGQDSYGQIDYKVKYNIELPKDKHDAAATWDFEDDSKNTGYNLQQYHPYAAKSNVYYNQQSYH